MRPLSSILCIGDHKCPDEVRADQEFDKGVLRRWMSERGARFVPLPARRHNKAGIVERKNRVVKDVLEKLDQDKGHGTFKDKLVIAQFSSNILYGSKVMSSFEMVRGYTPSVNGSGNVPIPQEVRDAQMEMSARRLLATMLRSKPNWKPEEDLQVGQVVLALIPGGKRPRGCWTEMEITEIKEEHSVIVGRGRKKRVIAREDIRTIPTNNLAADTLREIHGVSRRSKNDDKMDHESEYEEDEGTSSSSGDESEINPKGPQDGRSDGYAKDHSDGDAIESDHEGAKSTASEGEGNQHGNPREESQPRRSGRKSVPPNRLTYLTVNPIDRKASIQSVLQEAYNVFQQGQFYRRDAPFIPPFVFDESNKRELVKNWVPNMERIPIIDVPEGSNIIGSHPRKS